MKPQGTLLLTRKEIALLLSLKDYIQGKMGSVQEFRKYLLNASLIF